MVGKTEADAIKPPDGGWGWVMVGCVFFVRFMSFGTLLSIGVAFHLLMEEFNCTKSEISVIASISFSLQCFLGPIISMLQDRFGTRAVVFAGALVISLSFMLSAFAPNVFYLYFAFGVLGGCGMGLIYLPVMVVLSYYFEKKRSIATALGGMGSYAGCFVHPYLMRYMILCYGWRPAFIVIGALTLNSLPAAMLLRPLMPSRKKTPEQIEKGTTENDSTEPSAGHLEIVEENENDEKAADIGPKELKHPNFFGRQKSLHDENQHQKTSRNRTLSECTNKAMAKTLSASAECHHRLLKSAKELSMFRSSGGIFSPISPDERDLVPLSENEKKTAFSEEETALVPENEAEKQAVIKEESKSLRRRFSDYMKELVEMFKIPEFTAFIVSNILICIVYYMPSLFITDWGKEIGIPPERTTVLLSFVGLGNIFGRPILAIIGDVFRRYRILLFSSLVLISGSITVVTPWFPNFPFMAFFVFQYAVFTGGSQTFLTPILADMLPLSKLGPAFGILLAVEGAAILLGPPILVLFPTYAITFTIAGFILIASGIVLVVITYGKRLIELIRRGGGNRLSESTEPPRSSDEEKKEPIA